VEERKGLAGAVSADERLAMRNGRTGDGSKRSGGDVAAFLVSRLMSGCSAHKAVNDSPRS
jgi:hypothetical protein